MQMFDVIFRKSVYIREAVITQSCSTDIIITMSLSFNAVLLMEADCKHSRSVWENTRMFSSDPAPHSDDHVT